MGDYLRRAYDEAERVASRGNSDATQTRQDVVDEVEQAVKVACDGILPAHYMTEGAYQHLRQRVAELRAENDRLRDLVSNCHGWLAVNCEKGYVIPRNGLDAIEQSMRELGIEVDA